MSAGRTGGYACGAGDLVGCGRALLVWLLLPALAGGAQLSRKQEKINAQHADAIAAAQTAAEAWLKIEDAESYDKSWAAAAEYFRSQVPEKGWVQHESEMRKPLDPLLARDLEASAWKTEVPNLPKGEYVAFVYQTTFANGHPQLESLVMTHEGDAWKMVGYAVQ
ncbi:MAG TPA: DUF4019 domain-containing protein [Acidobacteriaceae bacterium]|nr:DUF4019 domain-containing protein [Acidobacteriaceae bacterium]